MIPESSMALMMISSEGSGALTMTASLLTILAEGSAGAGAVLTSLLAGGCDCLEHPDQTNADNISINSTKTPFTLLLISFSFYLAMITTAD
jgi:hypothetical protein